MTDDSELMVSARSRECCNDGIRTFSALDRALWLNNSNGF